MQNQPKSTPQILRKLAIEKLNPMQDEAFLAIQSFANTIILSPTGTGKTLAFLLPLIEELDKECKEVQLLILVPSRELALQIEQVVRNMGTGYKVNAIYGGRAGAKDKIDLKESPAILIGTPGRIADRFRRDELNKQYIKTLVLDEFDKSLEVGFESDMKEIVEALNGLKKRVLTSATNQVSIPDFVKLDNPKTIDYLDRVTNKLEVKLVESATEDKLDTLVDLIRSIGNQNGIIFCNFKDSIQTVSDYLTRNHIDFGCFYGGMEQKDRERVLIKFRNGTHKLLLATDLAARGLDIPALGFIIHFELPQRIQEFTHRNGRTGRMKNDGLAYVLKWKKKDLPHFMPTNYTKANINNVLDFEPSEWRTLFISGGRKDKISKGDITGLLFKQGGLTKDEVGVIELKSDCAFVGVHTDKIHGIIDQLNNVRLKKKKVRLREI